MEVKDIEGVIICIGDEVYYSYKDSLSTTASSPPRILYLLCRNKVFIKNKFTVIKRVVLIFYRFLSFQAIGLTQIDN